MRVCTAKQMAAIDRETIAGGVDGLELMERAGAAITEVILERLDDLAGDGYHACDHHDHDEDAPAVLVLCGKGNNCGDGLVIARHLEETGVAVTVLLLADPAALSPSATANLQRLPAGVATLTPPPADRIAVLEMAAAEADLLVDAVFGTGIQPPLRGDWPDLFRAINDLGLPCVAVDIPSGVDGNDGRVEPVAVAADVTATVGLPKRGLLLPPGRDFAGEIEVVDIGFPPEICERHAPELHWLPRQQYLELLPPRPGTVHKYDCGHALVVAGSRTFGGAAHLAGLGALRSGAGLVTVAAPRCLEIPLRVGLPEALVAPLAETADGTIAPMDASVLASLLEKRRALAIGPGLGSDPDTDTWVTNLLADLDLPVVVDADALGAFSRSGREPVFANDQVILTPHAGELGRLLGLPSGEVEARRLELAGELAARWNVVLLLKGSPAVIGTPDGRVTINASGDDALARGGSGDVLTGLLAGLLAQGLAAREAALLGAYVHGLAGTFAATNRGNRSVLVREIADAVGPVLVAMEQEASTTSALRERIWPPK